MKWRWIKLAVILVVIALATFFVVKSEYKLNSNFGEVSPFLQNHQFHLGLDLSGGSHLVYKADLSQVGDADGGDLMDALRDVIERRVNLFGVSEPIVQVQSGSFFSGGEERLIVDLPGVTDVEEATRMIGETPLLEFKTEAPEGTPQKATVDENGQVTIRIEDQFIATELTGRYLKHATLVFDPNTREPMVSLEFDDIGKELFAQITKENVGKIVAIYLDGEIISSPVVREEITAGEAVISGSMTPAEAKTLVGRLNSGSLPVPISLLSKQTIGATLGDEAVQAGIKAAIIGFILVALFLILWYRLPGLVSVLALCMFVVIVLAIFKLIPVTLTAAGIAGFIISMGLAVDANVLISERIKEEMRAGKSIKDAVGLGFDRAWFSIRDSNTSSIITAVILFWFGTSLIKGFALTLGIGVLISLFSAVSLTKLFLSLLANMKENKVTRFLFSSGITKI
ncbi:protein-export membrane protein SecD [Candidatus Nomurabacteria bacterium RIFCSPHIGHO2_01_FULL_40_24b]|uniref:Protein translocase subunit SecD n=1 Tax=Candidatus Nomurabacteria bacterium RIFCSPHIGHO2_01_FULL_40_24b TaxID=1801739 RepID=A0A1F6V914_9BACT|nr:MAG: protein-export membrane protein SecD [Candidatus Nomurabacteria bacterium RIFCSPHIGHO2_01_FULL_40_24b]